MKSSETISQLAKAIADASLEFPPIERGRTAKVKMRENKGEYSYDYADLGDVLTAVRGPLAKQGVSISHDCVVHYDPLRVETTVRLRHSSGEWEESSPLSLPCDGLMSETQQIGSACTYGKRYTVQSILGLSTECDDDGNGASGQDATTGKREPLPACPQCGKQSSVIVGKPEYGGGLVCFKKKEGCGHAWATEQHPAFDKDGKPIVAEPPKAEPPKAESKKEPICKEYEQLAKFLHEIGCQTPVEATACVRFAGGDFTIGELKQRPQDCLRILTALEGADRKAILHDAMSQAV